MNSHLARKLAIYHKQWHDSSFQSSSASEKKVFNDWKFSLRLCLHHTWETDIVVVCKPICSTVRRPLCEDQRWNFRSCPITPSFILDVLDLLQASLFALRRLLLLMLIAQLFFCEFQTHCCGCKFKHTSLPLRQRIVPRTDTAWTAYV